MGKTSFLADAVIDAGENGVMILTGEDGLSEHVKYRDITPVYADDKGDYLVFGENGKKEEWPKFLEVLKKVYLEWAAPGKVLAIDSVDLIVNGSCVNYCVETYFEDKEKYDRGSSSYVTKSKREQAMEFGGNQLLKQMAIEFDKFLTIIKYLQNKGVTVYTSWHSSVFKWKNPHEDADYDKICVDLKATKESNLREMLKNNCSMLLYADIKSKANKKTNRVEGGDRAYLFTESTASFDATKARGIELPEEMLFDYSVFSSYIEKIPAGKSNFEVDVNDVVEEQSDSPFINEMKKLQIKLGEEKFDVVLKKHNISDFTLITERKKQVAVFSELMKIV